MTCMAARNGYGSSTRHNARAPYTAGSDSMGEPARASPTKAPPTPRGGGRGPAAALAARYGSPEAPPPPLAPPAGAGIDSTEEALPPGVKGADFKTLQAMIEKGLQDSEENSILLEASLSGGQWGAREEAEEAEWKRMQQSKREIEAAAREKEHERAREQRRSQDEERRRQQTEDLEREFMEERSQQSQSAKECQRGTYCRETDAATLIQAHVRGLRSRRARVKG